MLVIQNQFFKNIKKQPVNIYKLFLFFQWKENLVKRFPARDNIEQYYYNSDYQ